MVFKIIYLTKQRNIYICLATNFLYSPFNLINSSWVPLSIISPLLKNKILSEFLIVDNLWAIIMVVIFLVLIILSKANCTSLSLSASKAEVASSNIKF